MGKSKNDWDTVLSIQWVTIHFAFSKNTLLNDLFPKKQNICTLYTKNPNLDWKPTGALSTPCEGGRPC